jgi:hypothetical protein
VTPTLSYNFGYIIPDTYQNLLFFKWCFKAIERKCLILNVYDLVDNTLSWSGCLAESFFYLIFLITELTKTSGDTAGTNVTSTFPLLPFLMRWHFSACRQYPLGAVQMVSNAFRNISLCVLPLQQCILYICLC